MSKLGRPNVIWGRSIRYGAMKRHSLLEKATKFNPYQYLTSDDLEILGEKKSKMLARNTAKIIKCSACGNYVITNQKKDNCYMCRYNKPKSPNFIQCSEILKRIIEKSTQERYKAEGVKTYFIKPTK